MMEVFGDTVELMETKESYSFHGYFTIKFWYRPARLFIIIKSEGWLFSVRLEQDDGCFAHLNQIQDYPNGMSIKDIEDTISILKSGIDQPITFYKSTGSALYRKEGDEFIKLSWDDIRALSNKNRDR